MQVDNVTDVSSGHRLLSAPERVAQIPDLLLPIFLELESDDLKSINLTSPSIHNLCTQEFFIWRWFRRRFYRCEIFVKLWHIPRLLTVPLIDYFVERGVGLSRNAAAYMAGRHRQGISQERQASRVTLTATHRLADISPFLVVRGGRLALKNIDVDDAQFIHTVIPMLETGQPEMQEAALAVMQHFLLRVRGLFTVTRTDLAALISWLLLNIENTQLWQELFFLHGGPLNFREPVIAESMAAHIYTAHMQVTQHNALLQVLGIGPALIESTSPALLRNFCDSLGPFLWKYTCKEGYVKYYTNTSGGGDIMYDFGERLITRAYGVETWLEYSQVFLASMPTHIVLRRQDRYYKHYVANVGRNDRPETHKANAVFLLYCIKCDKMRASKKLLSNGTTAGSAVEFLASAWLSPSEYHKAWKMVGTYLPKTTSLDVVVDGVLRRILSNRYCGAHLIHLASTYPWVAGYVETEIDEETAKAVFRESDHGQLDPEDPIRLGVNLFKQELVRQTSSIRAEGYRKGHIPLALAILTIIQDRKCLALRILLREAITRSQNKIVRAYVRAGVQH